MSLRRLRQRLRESGQRLRARSYARLAGYWHDGVLPEEEARVEGLFRRLVDEEAAEGTCLEAVLARLPGEMEEALRRALHGILADDAN
jgi:hypothetical protein